MSNKSLSKLYSPLHFFKYYKSEFLKKKFVRSPNFKTHRIGFTHQRQISMLGIFTKKEICV